MPFLKPKDKSVAGLIIKQRTPDEKPESEQDDSSASIDACAEELIRAVHARDTKAVANAMKDAFTILESEPHKEGEHVEKHTYAAQNEKAAQEP